MTGNFLGVERFALVGTNRNDPVIGEGSGMKDNMHTFGIWKGPELVFQILVCVETAQKKVRTCRIPVG